MASRPLITEALVRDAARAGRSDLPIPKGALITPLARDTARELGITLAEAKATGDADCGCEKDAAGKAPPGTLAIASDHAGFEIKAAMLEHAQKLGWTVRDLGTNSAQSVDYPDFAYAVARLVASGDVALGVMIDGVGVGSAMVANKVPGVRAACCSVEFAAFNARAHNDANVLTLGSRSVGLEANRRILEVFLQTAFEGGRHAGRVKKITDVEKRFG
jgi:ribose 5-phosphate isomerase B